MWFVITLAWIALVAGIFWAYRRKQAKLEAEREKQFTKIINEVKADPAVAVVAAEPALPPVPLVAVVPPTTQRAPVADCSGRPSLLPQPHALLYFILRTGLPDHEIFANLALADVLDLGSSLQGYDREQKTRSLAQLKVDFVVCTRKLEVVAAIIIGDAAPALASIDKPGLTEQWLKAAGVRSVRIDRTALPRHHQVREMVYGREAKPRAGTAPV